MFLYVQYFLSDRGRIEAVAKDKAAMRDQEATFPDKDKKSLQIPGFYVDQEGNPRIDLRKTWEPLDHCFRGDKSNRKPMMRGKDLELDAPLESLDEAIKVATMIDSRKKELEAQGYVE